jgi:O-antigen/teichoic acid export membrane protein
MSINHRRLSITVAAGLLLEAINKVSPLLILHHAQKTLGLTDFGIAQYQLTMLESVQPFITFGFANYALAERAVQTDNQTETSAIFSHIGALKIINALLFATFIVISTPTGHAPFSQSIYSTGILTLILAACVADSMWYCIAKHKLAQMSLLTGLFRITTLILILLLVDQRTDMNLFIVLCILPNVATSIYSGYYACKNLEITRIAAATMKKIVIKSAPFAILILLVTILDRIDIFLVERWYGPEGAGIYSGPAKVVQSLSLLIAGLATPFYAETMKVNESESLYKHVSLSLWLFTALAAPIIFGIPFIEKQALSILFKDLPASAENLLSVTSIGILGTVLSSVFALQILMPKSRPWPVIIGATIGLLISCAIAWASQPSFGIHSAAIGIVCGKILFGLTCLWASREFLPKLPLASFLKPMLAGACMSIFLYLIASNDMAVNLGCGGLSYVFFLSRINQKEFNNLIRHPKIKSLLGRF